MSRTFAPLIIGAACIAALLLTALLPARLSAQPQPPRANQAISIEGVVSRTQIINFDQGIARFDSTTGAIERFSGDLSNPSTQGVWIEHVRGVDETSGLLELQHPRGVENFANATFLVDIVSGATWLLHRRGSRATWEPVVSATP